jgi:adenine specific DNA methylase Mod
MMTENKLFFGDSLNVLRENIPDESIDLIYLDPPFNSKRPYNLLFKSPKGHQSDAQITAFEDTWHWNEQTEHEFHEVLRQQNTDTAELMRSLRSFLGENDMMAYLTMMGNRLLELHRVLAENGSLYLHCDPTASHYLKIFLDGVFGATRFRTEINWKRSTAHSDGKQGRQQYGNIRDTILFYTKSDKWNWNTNYTPYSQDYIDNSYKNKEKRSGRLYQLDNITGPGGASKGNPQYEVMGVVRYWRYSRKVMQELIDKGRIVQTKPGNVPRYKRYLDEMPGVPLQNDWQDISPARGGEYLGYPTQKPLSLLERIIKVSSNKGDVVLDPFCGCGTAIHAAQRLNRHWIGIDITHLAISLIEKRLKDAFPKIKFEVYGTPKSFSGAKDLAERDKYQFQWWACSLINAQPYKGKKKGADGGIDGLIYFQDEEKTTKKIVISVKGGKNIHRDMIADLKNTVAREKAEMGFFVTLYPPTKPMIKEACSAGFYESPNVRHIDFPKIQILEVEKLLSGEQQPRFPTIGSSYLSFRKPKRENLVAEGQKMLFD